MKTAISIPDGVFKASDRLARKLKLSRSELYAWAEAAFLERHAEKTVTAALDEVYANAPRAHHTFGFSGGRGGLRFLR